MSQWVGKFTISSTGSAKYFTVGSFLPTWAKIYIDEDNSGTDPTTHVCFGETDGTNQSYESSAKNGANENFVDGTDKIIRHYEWNGSSFVPVVEASFVSFTVLGGLNTIRLNVTTASSNYKAKIVCGD